MVFGVVCCCCFVVCLCGFFACVFSTFSRLTSISVSCIHFFFCFWDRPPRSSHHLCSSAASNVYKGQGISGHGAGPVLKGAWPVRVITQPLAGGHACRADRDIPTWRRPAAGFIRVGCIRPQAAMHRLQMIVYQSAEWCRRQVECGQSSIVSTSPCFTGFQ